MGGKGIKSLNALLKVSQQVAELGFDPSGLTPEPMFLPGDLSQTREISPGHFFWNACECKFYATGIKPLTKHYVFFSNSFVIDLKKPLYKKVSKPNIL